MQNHLDILLTQNTFYYFQRAIYFIDDIEAIYSHIRFLKNMTQYNHPTVTRHYA